MKTRPFLTVLGILAPMLLAGYSTMAIAAQRTIEPTVRLIVSRRRAVVSIGCFHPADLVGPPVMLAMV